MFVPMDGISRTPVNVLFRSAQGGLGGIQGIEREETRVGTCQMRLAGVLVNVRPNGRHLKNARERLVRRSVVVEPLLEAVRFFDGRYRSLPIRTTTGGI